MFIKAEADTRSVALATQKVQRLRRVPASPRSKSAARMLCIARETYSSGVSASQRFEPADRLPLIGIDKGGFTLSPIATTKLLCRVFIRMVVLYLVPRIICRLTNLADGR